MKERKEKVYFNTFLYVKRNNTNNWLLVIAYPLNWKVDKYLSYSTGES